MPDGMHAAMSKRIANAVRHLKHRTLLYAFRGKPNSNHLNGVSRWHLQSEPECIEYLVTRALEVTPEAGHVLIIGNGESAAGVLKKRLSQRGVTSSIHSPDDLPHERSDYHCILAASFDAKGVSRIATAVMTSPLNSIPFEYTLSTDNYASLRKHDQPYYSADYFISPLLISDVDYFELYEESLTRFDLKCDIRDFMDLCQLIQQIGSVPGDVVEFGSYRGHSGYLISRLLEALNYDKRLFMFDTFSEFPVEANSVDSFWSKSHHVSFEEVEEKFRDRPNVTLVQGDFTQTLAQSGISKIAFAYVDCDSYRATKYLVDEIFDTRLSPRGMIIFEDYGHPALLGNRLAVHELLDHNANCFHYFSQFSGFLVVLKLD